MRVELAVVVKVFHYNMKNYLILLFLIIVEICSAQKNIQITQLKRYDKIYDEKYNDITVQIGKPVFIVVYITNNSIVDTTLVEREIKELKSNFKNTSTYRFYQKGKLIFNNSSKKNFSLDELNETYSKIFYWNGKKDSDVIEYDKIIKSSEYFSEYTGNVLKSSYIINHQKKKDSIKNELIWNPNNNSKILSNKYIKKFLFLQMKVLEHYDEFFDFDFKTVKKITINTDFKELKNPWQEIYFNKNGLPNYSIISSDDKEHSKGKVTFEYKDNLISKITISFKSAQYGVYEDIKNIYYNNEKLIVADDLRVNFYKLKSDFLNYESFYSDNENYTYLIDSYRLENNNVLSFIESGWLNNFKTKFNQLDNFFPLTNTLRPHSDNLISTISKIDDLNYSSKVNKVEVLKIKYLNKNLIKEIIFKKADDLKYDKKVDQHKFEFLYENYK